MASGLGSGRARHMRKVTADDGPICAQGCECLNSDLKVVYDLASRAKPPHSAIATLSDIPMGWSCWDMVSVLVSAAKAVLREGGPHSSAS